MVIAVGFTSWTLMSEMGQNCMISAESSFNCPEGPEYLTKFSLVPARKMLLKMKAKKY